MITIRGLVIESQFDSYRDYLPAVDWNQVMDCGDDWSIRHVLELSHRHIELVFN